MGNHAGKREIFTEKAQKVRMRGSETLGVLWLQLSANTSRLFPSSSAAATAPDLGLDSRPPWSPVLGPLQPCPASLLWNVFKMQLDRKCGNKLHLNPSKLPEFIFAFPAQPSPFPTCFTGINQLLHLVLILGFGLGSWECQQRVAPSPLPAEPGRYCPHPLLG